MNSDHNPPDVEDFVGDDATRGWPQRLRLSLLLPAVAFAAISAFGLETATSSWHKSDQSAAVGSAGFAVMMAFLAFTTLPVAGIRHIGLSRRIRPHRHPVHGYGVTIPMNRILILLVIATLAGGAAYGASAAIGWYIGIGGTLLPAGRDTREGATFMAVCAAGSIGLILLFTLVRIDTTVSIYRDGVERYVRRRILFSTRISRIFLDWDDIAAIDVGDIGGNFGSEKHPAIDLHTEFVPDSVRTPHDTDHKITLMAHVLPVEPNTLLALLRKLHAEPEQRALITRPAAVELLRPPPLFERFRAARAQKTAR